MVRQGERYARASRSEDRSGSRQAERRVLEHPVDELVFALPHPGALAFEHLVPRSPSQHQERDYASQQQREPTACEQLCRVGGNEDEFDHEQRSVDGRDGERVVAPLQGDKGCQDRGDRHQDRDGDAVGAAQRVGGAEGDHRPERACGEQPVDHRHIDLPLLMTGRMEHPHTRQKAELDRLLGQ